METEIIPFCLQTQYFFYIWKSISTKNSELYYTQIWLTVQWHVVWNDFFGEMAETIQHYDSPLNTIFFSLNEPYAHQQEDWIWAEKW